MTTASLLVTLTFENRVLQADNRRHTASNERVPRCCCLKPGGRTAEAAAGESLAPALNSFGPEKHLAPVIESGSVRPRAYYDKLKCEYSQRKTPPRACLSTCVNTATSLTYTPRPFPLFFTDTCLP